MRHRIRQAMSGLLVIATMLFPITLAAPVQASANITQYPLASSDTRATGIVGGPDGALWLTNIGPFDHRIVRLSTSGQTADYTFTDPYTFGQATVNSITAGSDGALWFIESTAIGRITTSGQITTYPLPPFVVFNGRFQDQFVRIPASITAGPDGALWFTDVGRGNAVGRISASGDVTIYPIPTTDNSVGSGLLSITAGPDGALWFTEASTSKIGRITTTGDLTEYNLPNSIVPTNIVGGPDGALWFTENNYNNIGRITTTGDVSEYAFNAAATGASDIAAGPDGALWFTGNANNTANFIGRVTISGDVTEYPTARGGAGIAAGPDGAIWFTEGDAVGRLAIASPVPQAPANLSIPSPTREPILAWDPVGDATSYNIYRDSILIGSTASTSYADNNATEGTSSYYVTAINSSGESQPSSAISALIDETAPDISYILSPPPINGWNNSSVTVTFNCADNNGGSGVASCTPPQTESIDGTYTLSGTAVDNAGNQANIQAEVKIDQTAPVVSNVTLQQDPIAVGQSTTLSANVVDGLSGTQRVEYYTGSDPGQGNGTPMNVVSGVATASVGNYTTAGMYDYHVRAQDIAGNWSAPMSVTMDVYNPAGGYVAGHGFVAPGGPTSNTNPSDTLPMESGNNVKASFDFTVEYLNANSTTPTGASTFSWGSTCNNSHSDCFKVVTDTGTNSATGLWSWLIVPGDNTATFQGTAQLSQGSTNLGSYPVRVSVVATTPTFVGHYLLQVFPAGSNPATATPLYQASGDLIGGSVVLHQ